MKDNRFYVYQIIDPRDNKILYIGKGIGGRCYFHFTITKKHREKNKAKKDKGLFEILEDILDNTMYTQFDCVNILHYKLSDKEAKKIELSIIKSIGYENLYNIHNKAEWMNGSKWMNDGIINKQFLAGEEIPKEFFYLGKIKNPNFVSKNKGRVWINNGKIQKMVFENEIPVGFIKGSLNKSNLGKQPWNKGLKKVSQ
jgi:hypothetical protein